MPLRAALIPFDLTPRFHPTCGAWGCTPTMTSVDQPLLGRCLALAQDDRLFFWFASDLVGENVPGTDALRAEVAAALDVSPQQIIWSTSQTHSSGAVPGSVLTGSAICDLSKQDPAFMAAERQRFMQSYITAARTARAQLEPVQLWAGRGFCDSVSYNTRFPMPTGGVKFSRHHSEGLQSGKFFDTTIGLVRFHNQADKPLGALFNFCAHPATMINASMISSDWVGAARQQIENALDASGGAPAMFIQGFCGDVNCHHLFGTPALARRTGTRLGQAAVAALPTLVPLRAAPLRYRTQTIHLACQPMPSRAQLEDALAARAAFRAELDHDDQATWFCGINAPDRLTVPEKKAFVEVQMKYLREGLRILAHNEPVRTTLPFTLSALRLGDVAALLSPGENFTQVGSTIRTRSPFNHTLICGDTNGLFGYLGADEDIDRGGYETDSYWKMLYIDGFRLPPAQGTADLIIRTALNLLEQIHDDDSP